MQNSSEYWLCFWFDWILIKFEWIFALDFSWKILTESIDFARIRLLGVHSLAAMLDVLLLNRLIQAVRKFIHISNHNKLMWEIQNQKINDCTALHSIDSSFCLLIRMWCVNFSFIFFFLSFLTCIFLLWKATDSHSVSEIKLS